MSGVPAKILAASLTFVCAFHAGGAVAQPAEVHPPRLLEHDDPDDPRPHAGGGGVVLYVTVERDGTTGDVQVADSGGSELDAAAIAAARSYRFAPATRDGLPVRARVKVVVHFNAPKAQERPPTPIAPPPKPMPPAAANAPKPAPAAAQSGKGDDAPIEVRVLGAPKPPSRGASDFNLRVGDLAAVPRKNASELLTLAPGIMLSNEGGEGHAEQVFLRGFDAREGQDIEFSVDGVPINESGNLHGNGYADTHFIIPELVTNLRVLEGPFDPRQGNYAVAGSADYELGLEERGLFARGTFGSFGTARGLVMFAPPGQSTRTFGAAEVYSTSGFGQNRDAKRASAIGQYEGRLGESGSFRVTAQAFADSYHSAGLVREADYRAGLIGFYDTYDPHQGGDDSRYSIAALLNGRSGDVVFSQQVFLIQRGMRLREDFTGFLLDVQTPLQAPHGQRGDLIDLDMTEETLGARGSARLEGKALGQKQELEVGYFARGDRVDGTQYRDQDANAAPYHLDTNLSSKIGDVALYADVGLRPTSWLTLRGGARVDLFAFDVLNLCAVESVAHPSKSDPPGDQSCLSQQDRGVYREPVSRASTASNAVLPRASVLVGPERGFVVSGSVGRGARSVDPSYIVQDIPSPFASVFAYDGGVTYARGHGNAVVVVKSILFQTKVDKDLIFSDTAGRNVIGGPTTRTGWVGAARVTGPFYDLNANATLVKSTFDDDPANGASRGLLVPYVPDAVGRFDGSIHGVLPAIKPLGRAVRAALSTGVTVIGDRPLPFGQRSDPVLTIDTSATINWTHYEFALSVTNLLDSQYRLGEYNYASNFEPDLAGRSKASAPALVPSRLFSAGPPRSIFATFGVHFGGDS